jgi:membrane protein implicated in regulation of membrane protease activity
LWILNLIRLRRLHIAYGVAWVFWIILGILIVTIEPLLNLVTSAVGAVFPASALSVLAFGLLFAMQIYLLSQLSILSRRILLIAQHIALEDLEQERRPRLDQAGNQQEAVR